MKKVIITLMSALILAPSVMALTYNEAKLQDKPMIVYIYMDFCSGCKQVSPVFEKMKSMFSGKYNFVKENASHSKVADRLGVHSVPKVFIIEPKTQETKQIAYDCTFSSQCFADMLKNYKR